MKQPELGKKISELRLAKGLTQTELAEMCQVSLRTIQRIETAEVSPRSFTLRLIFKSLDAESFLFMPISETAAPKWQIQLEQFFKSFLELFNLKSEPMKKITILTLITVAVVFVLTSLNLESQAQSDTKVRKTIEAHNENFVRWFNNEDKDSLLQMYTKDACLLTRGCGESVINSYYNQTLGTYQFTRLTTSDVTVSKHLAIEKGTFMIELPNGQNVGGAYMTEWQFTDGKWLIAYDLAAPEKVHIE